MSWSSRFDEQWYIFTTIVESRIRREIESENPLETEAVNFLIQEEIKRSWLSSTHLNGAWLHNLKHEHLELGEKLQDSLMDLRIKGDYTIGAQLQGRSLLAGLGLGSVAFILGRQFFRSRWTQLTSAAFAGILGGSITGTIWKTRRQREVDEMIKCLHRELESEAQALQVYTKEADRQSENSASHEK